MIINLQLDIYNINICHFNHEVCSSLGFLGVSVVKNLPVNAGDAVLSPGDPLEKETAIHSNILAWQVPWTKEPGGLQSTE